MKTPSSPQSPRRHDLDALRAFAMLLGIVLHGALSFLPIPWPIQDSQQNLALGWLVSAIHGFRMPVFFVMSGFFTAMLWRRRGLQALLHHRFRRIFLPLLLGLLTVVPAVEWASRSALSEGAESTASSSEAGSDDSEEVDEEAAPGLTPLSRAVINDSLESVRALLDAGTEVDGLNLDGSTPLIIAALVGHHEAAGLLVEAGANVDLQGSDGSAAIHTAAFFGRTEVVATLLAAGADLTIKNAYGQTPPEVLAADWQTTAFIAQMVDIELDREELEAARAEIARLMSEGVEVPEIQENAGFASWIGWLMFRPFFHHLWFLWFLCWLVAAFAGYAALSDRYSWRDRTRALVLSPQRLLWLVPVTAIPQFFMGRFAPVFGADTSAGILPMPHVLAFYGIFFFFGALYYDAQDEAGKVGRYWALALVTGLLIFPVGAGLAYAGVHNVELGTRLVSVSLQALYPWLMLFGLMGLFRRFLGGENRRLRYLSDASYWLYLAHLPLIMWAQALVREGSLPAVAKLALITIGVTALLLVIYQVAVRYTWLGRLLNGPRERPAR